MASNSSPSCWPLGVSRYIGSSAKAAVVQQEAERFHAQLAAADVCVAVDARAERFLAVVEVKRATDLQADGLVERGHRRLVVLLLVPSG